MMNRARLTMALFFAAGSLLWGQVQKMDVDVSENLGPITLTIGTNCGPRSMSGSADYTRLFQDLGITAIRTHDYYGPCDWYEIFPDWNADPQSPASYQFATSDEKILAITSGGFDVLFRLGTSWRGGNLLPINDPPGTVRNASGAVTHVADSLDFNKFAEICLHIVMHYNDGWANGYYLNIKRWEIWNEPSLCEQFWTGTQLQFFWLFERVAKKLKAYDPTLKVGGPGQAGHSTEGYQQGLITYLQQHQVPLDFYSYHSYGDMYESSSPWDIGRKALQNRKMLDDYGYATTELYCDEWNASLNKNYFGHTGRGAAFYGAALTYMVQTGVTESYQYRADDHGLGLVLQSGRLRIAAAALQAWKALTTASHRVACSHTDSSNFTAMATQTEDGQTIRVLIANFPDSEQTVQLLFRHAAPEPQSDWRFVRKQIADDQWLTTVDSSVVRAADSLALQFVAPPQSVQLLELKRQDTATGVQRSVRPEVMSLLRNFPNPFNQSTTIEYGVLVDGPVELAVYDLLGRRVMTLMDRIQSSGMHRMHWDADHLASGLYLLKVCTAGQQQVLRIHFIK